MINIINWLHNFFNIEFFQQLVTTLIAIIIGLRTALYIDKKIKDHQIKEEKPKLIKAIIKSLEYNLKLISKIDIKPSLEQEATITFIFDNSLLNTTSIKKYEILQSIELCQKIDNIKYNLDLLNFQIKSMTDHHIAAVTFRRTLEPFKKILASFKLISKSTESLINETIIDLKNLMD